MDFRNAIDALNDEVKGKSDKFKKAKKAHAKAPAADKVASAEALDAAKSSMDEACTKLEKLTSLLSQGFTSIEQIEALAGLEKPRKMVPKGKVK
ncbi:MAG: hypothetical protein ACYS76_13420 [Planctomycetota bacterium]|jgi:Tfp pilus assembly protein FimV